MKIFPVRVICYSGYRGEQEPRSFDFGKEVVEVRSIIDRWTGPDYRYFKILGSDGCIYILRHDEYAWRWKLTFFQHA